MRTRVMHVRETLRSSLWLAPTLMSAAAAALAFGTLHFDAAYGGDALPAAVSFSAGADAARALLTTIAGAMIGVTGVTFSITVVALSLASQQFGPRLLRNFLRDRANQLVLGTFLATFVFSLLVLQAIEEGTPAPDIPRLSVTVAMLLALASLAALIYFIHHVAHGIQADSVIAGVERELRESIDRMYPERMGEEPEDVDPDARRAEGEDRDAYVVRSEESGYLQAIEEEEVFALAERDDLVVRLVHRPGDFVIEGAPVLLAWPRSRVPDGFAKEARALLILGKDRTTEQDVEFSIDQLVEVAVRALSPGINDPFTAVRCVDRLGAGLCRLATRRFPSPYRHDRHGNLRVVAHRPDLPGLVDAAFDQIRAYGARSVAVTVRLLEVIEIVAGCSGRRRDLRDALDAQAERILDGARKAGHAACDMEDIERRYRDAKAALEAQSGAGGVAMQPQKRR